MHIDVCVDFKKYSQSRLIVQADVQAEAGGHGFTLSALSVGNGISVAGWEVTGGVSRVEGARVTVTGDSFSIRYDVEVRHEVCLGSGNDADLVYPFINANEVFFGTGILPVPQEACTAAFRLAGLPQGWNEFSSLTPGGMHADKLAAFFCYCATGTAPVEHAWRGKSQEVTFRVLKQRGKALPMPEQALFDLFDGYMNWLENSLAPYQRAGEINFLVLQAPGDFAKLAGGRTFASGENVLNGIACYAPADEDYLKNYYGSASYAQFLYEGLAHELTHFYTAAVPGSREKSVLYPAPGCPQYAVRLLGDALNNYFYSKYVSAHIPEAQGAFDRWLTRARAARKRTGKRQPLLDLVEMDTHLQASGSTLLTLFREMVQSRLADRRPYDSAAILFDTMRTRLQIPPPPDLETAIMRES